MYDDSWMNLGLCGLFPDLPWIHDEDLVTDSQSNEMRRVCAICAVSGACSAYVVREEICGGFWAGRHRDIPGDAMGGAA